MNISENIISFELPPPPSKEDADYYTYGIGLSAQGSITNVSVTNNAILNCPCKGIDISDLVIPSTAGPAKGMIIARNLIYNAGCDTSVATDEHRAAISSNLRQLLNCYIYDNQISFPSNAEQLPRRYAFYVNTAATTSGVFIYNNHLTAPVDVRSSIVDSGITQAPPPPAALI